VNDHSPFIVGYITIYAKVTSEIVNKWAKADTLNLAGNSNLLGNEYRSVQNSPETKLIIFGVHLSCEFENPFNHLWNRGANGFRKFEAHR